MQVRVKKLHPLATIPKYANPGDAGLDLVAIDNGTTQCLKLTELNHEGARGMKFLTLLLLLLSGCTVNVSPEPFTFDCQILPYAIKLRIDRYSEADAIADAKLVATRLKLKDYDIVCRPKAKEGDNGKKEVSKK